MFEPKEVIYNNFVWASVDCAFVFAMNINGKYIPVAYSPVDVNDTMFCSLVSKENTYQGLKEGNYFKFYNIIPGEYEMIFTDSFYMYDISTISVADSTEAKTTFHTIMPEIYYSEYEIFYKSYSNIYYEFRNNECTYKIVDDVFVTDENGVFKFLVNWKAEKFDLNIHEVNGSHVSIQLKEQSNGAKFIN